MLHAADAPEAFRAAGDMRIDPLDVALRTKLLPRLTKCALRTLRPPDRARSYRGAWTNDAVKGAIAKSCEAIFVIYP